MATSGDELLRTVETFAARHAGVDDGTGGGTCDGTCDAPANLDEVPQLVLLDVCLPDGDGVELCRDLRTRPECAGLPVILISAHAGEDARVAGLEAGAHDFIAKPFYPRELLAKVYRCLQDTADTQELRDKTTELEEEAERHRQDLDRTERELKKQQYSNQTLMSLCQELAGSLQLDELLNTFMLMVLGQLGARSVAIFLPAENSDVVLLPRAVKGCVIDRLQGLCISTGDDLGKLLSERRGPAEIEWLLRRPGMRLPLERLRAEGFELINPVEVHGRLTVVVLVGTSMSERPYDATDIEIFDTLCKTAGVAIQNASLFRELRETCLGIVRTLMSTLEAKDAYTRGHTERVAMYSVAIAKEMGVEGDTLEDIRFGATLHDIGKLAITDTVLKKPAALSREERQHIMSHPVRGATLLEGLRFLGPAADMVLHHHENLDGSGYPDGLSGEEISIGARIVAVADAFDAMTSGRTYMKSLGVAAAIDNLRQRAGHQYDQHVVEALERVIANGQLRLGI
jgi:response regulator RpfG family c-di-GMP phosphodiesterase